MVKVESKRYSWNGESKNGYNFKFEFRVKNGGENEELKNISIFLAYQLESYLNREIE